MNLAWVITSEGKPSSEEKGSILHEVCPGCFRTVDSQPNHTLVRPRPGHDA